MSDKPLAERLRFTVDNFESGSAYAIGLKDGLIDAINKIESFVRERLTEQTEPSAEDWKIARIVRTHAGIERPCENKDCYRCYSRAYALLAGSNAERRRVRELLVGKTKGGDAT